MTENTYTQGNRRIAKALSLLGSLIAVAGVIACLRLPADFPGKTSLPFTASLISMFFSRVKFEQWTIDENYDSIHYTSTFSEESIPLCDLAHSLIRKHSIRIFYPDGSDKSLPTDGLPEEEVRKIKSKLISAARHP